MALFTGLSSFLDELKFYNVGKLDVFKTIGIVKYYTNIELPEDYSKETDAACEGAVSCALISSEDAEKIINEPVELLNKSIDIVEHIDINIFKKLSDDQLDDVKQSLSRLENIVKIGRAHV